MRLKNIFGIRVIEKLGVVKKFRGGVEHGKIFWRWMAKKFHGSMSKEFWFWAPNFLESVVAKVFWRVVWQIILGFTKWFVPMGWSRYFRVMVEMFLGSHGKNFAGRVQNTL